MGNSVFGVGVSALRAAQAGLVTTGHNIANAATPGYTRQRTIQEPALPQMTGSGFIGQGVDVRTVERVYSQFLVNQVRDAETEQARLSTYEAEISQIDNLLADPSAGLAPALQDLFRGIHDVATNPASVPSRQAFISGAQALVARFHALDGRLQDMRRDVDTQLASSVGAINSHAGQIAALNEDIVLAQNGVGNLPPNDLLDRRDELVAALNLEIGVAVIGQDDGSVNVFIGNGQPLVVGYQANGLKVAPSPQDPTRSDVAFVANGITQFLPDGSLRGGKLSGLLQFRAESIDPAVNALGRVAVGLASTMNAQHRLGQDLGGALGGDLFAVGAPVVSGNTLNSGTAQVTATLADAGALTASDYRLQYDGTNYNLTRLADGVTQTFAALPRTVDGVTLDLASGTPAAGDNFLVRPAATGAGVFDLLVRDTAKVAAAAPVRTAASNANAGTGRISAGTVTGAANLPLPGDVTLTYDQANNRFNVAGAVPAVAPVAYAEGAAIAFNGISFSVSGTPADGDTFTLSRNAGGVSDGRNALFLAELQTRLTLAGGTATYQSAYGQLVSQVGNRARELDVTARAQDNLVAFSRDAQQSVSGVNLDEEAANLLRYQQAYEAAAKLMQIANGLFGELLDIAR